MSEDTPSNSTPTLTSLPTPALERILRFSLLSSPTSKQSTTSATKHSSLRSPSSSSSSSSLSPQPSPLSTFLTQIPNKAFNRAVKGLIYKELVVPDSEGYFKRAEEWAVDQIRKNNEINGDTGPSGNDDISSCSCSSSSPSPLATVLFSKDYASLVESIQIVPPNGLHLSSNNNGHNNYNPIPLSSLLPHFPNLLSFAWNSHRLPLENFSPSPSSPSSYSPYSSTTTTTSIKPLCLLLSENQKGLRKFVFRLTWDFNNGHGTTGGNGNSNSGGIGGGGGGGLTTSPSIGLSGISLPGDEDDSLTSGGGAKPPRWDATGFHLLPETIEHVELFNLSSEGSKMISSSSSMTTTISTSVSGQSLGSQSNANGGGGKHSHGHGHGYAHGHAHNHSNALGLEGTTHVPSSPSFIPPGADFSSLSLSDEAILGSGNHIISPGDLGDFPSLYNNASSSVGGGPSPPKFSPTSPLIGSPPKSAPHQPSASSSSGSLSLSLGGGGVDSTAFESPEHARHHHPLSHSNSGNIQTHPPRFPNLKTLRFSNSPFIDDGLASAAVANGLTGSNTAGKSGGGVGGNQGVSWTGFGLGLGNMGEAGTGSGKGVRKVSLGSWGTKLTDKGIKAMLEADGSVLEELTLEEVEGRLSKKLWASISYLPPTLTTLRIVYSEILPSTTPPITHHSWVTDHLSSIFSILTLSDCPITHLSISRKVPLLARWPGGHPMCPTEGAMMREKRMERTDVLKLLENGGKLKELELDFWEISIEIFQALMEKCTSLERLKAMVDAPFSKILALGSSLANLKQLRSLVLSIPPTHTPLLATLPLPTAESSCSPFSASSCLSPDEIDSVSKTRASIPLPAALADVHTNSVADVTGRSNPTTQSQLQTLNDSIKAAVPPAKDIRRALKKSQKLEEIVWTGRGGLGTWRFSRAGVSTVKIDFEPITVALEAEYKRCGLNGIGIGPGGNANVIEDRKMSVIEVNGKTSGMTGNGSSGRRRGSSGSSLQMTDLSVSPLSTYSSLTNSGASSTNNKGRRGSSYKRSMSLSTNNTVLTTPSSEGSPEKEETSFEMDDDNNFNGEDYGEDGGERNSSPSPSRSRSKSAGMGNGTKMKGRRGSEAGAGSARRKSVGKSPEKIVIGSMTRGRT